MSKKQTRINDITVMNYHLIEYISVKNYIKNFKDINMVGYYLLSFYIKLTCLEIHS